MGTSAIIVMVVDMVCSFPDILGSLSTAPQLVPDLQRRAPVAARPGAQAGCAIFNHIIAECGLAEYEDY
jgi:hypothetical protein